MIMGLFPCWVFEHGNGLAVALSVLGYLVENGKEEAMRGELMNYTVFFSWDSEAEVWIATSPDVTGLVLEGDSLDALMKRVEKAIPELLELNSQTPAKSVSFVCNRTMACA